MSHPLPQIHTPVKDLSNPIYIGMHHDNSSPICSIRDEDAKEIAAAAQSNLASLVDILTCRGITTRDPRLEKLTSAIRAINELSLS